MNPPGENAACPIHVPLEYPSDLVCFVSWCHCRIIRTCQCIVARFGTQPAVNTAHNRGNKVPIDPFAEELEKSIHIIQTRVVDFESPFGDRRKFLLFSFLLRSGLQGEVEYIVNTDLWLLRFPTQSLTPPDFLIFFRPTPLCPHVLPIKNLVKG